MSSRWGFQDFRFASGVSRGEFKKRFGGSGGEGYKHLLDRRAAPMPGALRFVANLLE
jgi:hypothetical protein